MNAAVNIARKEDAEVEPTRPWIAYVGSLAYPPIMAASTRVLGVSMALMHAGFDVVILGDHPSRPQAEKSVLARSDTGRSVRYFPVLHRNLRSTRKLARLTNLYLLASLGAIDWLAGAKSLPACVIHYGSRYVPAIRLSSWCRRHKVPVVADVVEHMEGRQFPYGGAVSPAHLDHLLYRYALRSRFDGLLCISEWLDTRYRGRGMPTSVVRTILDTDAIQFRLGCPGSVKGLTLGYAGSSGNGAKDLLGIVIEAVLRCRAEGMDVDMNLAGVSPEELRPLLPRNQRVAGPFRALGWLPRERALSVMRDCDFMPLLRHDSMYAWAGFPTKVAESLALGTPAIVNPVGDVKDLVVDGFNGFQCAEPTVASLSATLARAYELDDSAVYAMRKAARETAVRQFDYRSVSNVVSRFVSEVLRFAANGDPSKV